MDEANSSHVVDRSNLWGTLRLGRNSGGRLRVDHSRGHKTALEYHRVHVEGHVYSERTRGLGQHLDDQQTPAAAGSSWRCIPRSGKRSAITQDQNQAGQENCTSIPSPSVASVASLRAERHKDRVTHLESQHHLGYRQPSRQIPDLPQI